MIHDPVRCLQLAKKYGFRYFSGNGTDPDQPCRIIESVVCFPSAFWMFPGYMQDRKHTLEWSIRIRKDHDVVVLIHPREYAGLFARLKEKINTFLAGVDEVVSFSQFTGSFGRSAASSRKDRPRHARHSTALLCAHESSKRTLEGQDEEV